MRSRSPTSSSRRCAINSAGTRSRRSELGISEEVFSSDLAQRRARVHGDVFGLVALDLVLGNVLAGVARMALVLGVASMDLDDPAAHMSGFRIPADVIADFEPLGHLNNAFARAHTSSGVKPYFCSISLPGAEAPKRSTPSTSPRSPT